MCERRRGEKKGSERESVRWGCDYATALDIEVDLQRCRFGRRESDLALERLVECRAFVPDESDWLLCDGMPEAVKCASVSLWACRKEDAKVRRACVWMCS